MKIKHVTSFPQRLAIANGIFYSKVVFLISVWGGAEEYLLNSIQIMINKAMRAICKVGRSVKIEELQRRTNWLSVRQAVMYHSLMEARRVLVTREPQYLYQRLTSTRAEATIQTRTRHGAVAPAPRLALTQSSWRYRVLEAQERLPRDLMDLPVGENRDRIYRNRLRAWVKSSVTNK